MTRFKEMPLCSRWPVAVFGILMVSSLSMTELHDIRISGRVDDSTCVREERHLMPIDHFRLDRDFHDYLKSPAGTEVFEGMYPSYSFGERLFATIFFLLLGILLLPTIRWTVNGLKLIW